MYIIKEQNFEKKEFYKMLTFNLSNEELSNKNEIKKLYGVI